MRFLKHNEDSQPKGWNLFLLMWSQKLWSLRHVIMNETSRVRTHMRCVGTLRLVEPFNMGTQERRTGFVNLSGGNAEACHNRRFQTYWSSSIITSSFQLGKKKKPVFTDFSLYAVKLFSYASEIASTGHVDAQAPQSIHVSGSIWYWSPPSEIASTGQSAAQAPQEMQASEILYAMSFHLHT